MKEKPRKEKFGDFLSYMFLKQLFLNDKFNPKIKKRECFPKPGHSLLNFQKRAAESSTLPASCTLVIYKHLVYETAFIQ